VQVHEKIDLSFERVLRSALRQDPDVMLVGEMRDQQTAEIGLRAAMTGHLVLSTLHTNDAASTPMRLLDMGVPRYMVALSLHLVLAQRLVRTVCTHCAEPHEPDAREQAAFEAAGMPMARRASQARTRLRALQPDRLQRPHRGLRIPRDGWRADRRAQPWRRHGVQAPVPQRMAGHGLRHDALRRALEGRSTVEEALRVSVATDEAGA
jgi:MSHA biogenesis protein MshE